MSRVWLYGGPCSLLVAAVALAGCGGSTDSATSAAASARGGTIDAPVKLGVEPRVVAPSGQPPDDLVITDLRKGTGPEAKPGPFLTTQFVALRWNGEPFQSSWDNDKFQIFSFKLGRALPQVNPGWERGIPGMRVGGRRELLVPPRYLYDHEVPAEYREPDDSLVFVVELLGVDK